MATLLILARSTVPHSWRQAIALFAVTVWLMLGVYLLVDGPVLWLVRQSWWGQFPTGQLAG